METIKILECKSTLLKQPYERDRIKVLWQWIKTNHINLSEYIFLTKWLFKDGLKN